MGLQPLARGVAGFVAHVLAAGEVELRHSAPLAQHRQPLVGDASTARHVQARERRAHGAGHEHGDVAAARVVEAEQLQRLVGVRVSGQGQG